MKTFFSFFSIYFKFLQVEKLRKNSVILFEKNWQEKLLKLEKAKKWDKAIEFMQQVIRENPNSLNVYLNMNFLLMNLLVEEDYDVKKQEHYAILAKRYFQESYAKFSNNPEYLFFTAITGVMSEWFFGIEMNDIEKMFQQTIEMEPDNILYQWELTPNIYIGSREEIMQNKIKATPYAQLILQKNSPIKKLLENKGSLGEYIWGMMVNWSKRVLNKNTTW